MKCLEKQRDERYESVDALSRDIQRHLTGEPVEARPHSANYRIRKFISKNKTILSTAAAFIVLMVVGTVVSLCLAVQANYALKLAKTNETRANKLALKAEQKAKEAKTYANQAEAEGLKAKQKTKEVQEHLIEIRKQKKEIETKARGLETSNEMLLSIFKNLEPSQGKKGESSVRVKIAKELDSCIRLLKTNAIGDELETAVMQTALGTGLTSLGYPEKAIPVLEDALETRRRLLGETHGNTGVTTASLGNAYYRSGKLEKSLEKYQTYLRMVETHYPELVEERVKILNNLGAANSRLENYEKACIHFEKMYLLANEHLGAEHQSTINALTNLGGFYLNLGNLNKSGNYLTKANEVSMKVLGKDHPNTLTSQFNLMDYFLDSGAFEKAQPLAEAIYRSSRSSFGMDHPDTLRFMRSLARVYQWTGKPELGVPLFEKAALAYTAKRGARDKLTQLVVKEFAECKRLLNLKNAGKRDHTELKKLANGIKDTLSTDDLFDSLQADCYRKDYLVRLKADVTYLISLSGEFDTFLRVENHRFHPECDNDNRCIPGDGRSQLLFTPTSDGDYYIVVTSAKKKATGQFVLKVRKTRMVVQKAPTMKSRFSWHSTKVGGHYVKLFPMMMTKGFPCKIIVRSGDFRPVVGLANGKKRFLIARGKNYIRQNQHESEIDFTANQTMKYLITVTTEKKEQTGEFQVEVRPYEPVD